MAVCLFMNMFRVREFESSLTSQPETLNTKLGFKSLIPLNHFQPLNLDPVCVGLERLRFMAPNHWSFWRSGWVTEGLDLGIG